MTLLSEHHRPPRRAAFSLIELLLVAVLVGIASAVAIPRFVNSFKGARLRSAARTLSMASRYARSTAVLHQKDMALIFYPERNEVEMVSLGRFVGAADQERFLDSRGRRAVAGLLDEDDLPPRESLATPEIESEMVRELPEGVLIVNVEVGGEIIDIEGGYVANFHANGMCDAFTMNILDQDERSASISVDPLSGKVTVEYGGTER